MTQTLCSHCLQAIPKQAQHLGVILCPRCEAEWVRSGFHHPPGPVRPAQPATHSFVPPQAPHK